MVVCKVYVAGKVVLDVKKGLETLLVHLVVKKKWIPNTLCYGVSRVDVVDQTLACRADDLV